MAAADSNLDRAILGMRRRAVHAQVISYYLIALIVCASGFAIYLFLQFSVGNSLVIGAQTNLGQAQINVGGPYDWLQEITRAIVRIGGVVMAVFVINILVSFARYNARLASALQARADCLLLANMDVPSLAALMPIVTTDIIDFPNTPQRPFDSYFEMVKSFSPGGAKKQVG